MYTWKNEAKKFECMIDSNNFSCVCGAIIPGTDEGGNGPAKVRPNDYIAITARIPTQTDLNLGFLKKARFNK
jgi:hypothetical protein